MAGVRKSGRSIDNVWSGRTRVLGVFGYPVGHSLSPAMHNAALAAAGLDYVYVPFEVEPERLGEAAQAIRALGIVGINVTIPHKEAIIEYMDEVSEEARLIGSVNTIHNHEGRLKGYSTDGEGFLESLRSEGFGPEGKRAVVLGAGGSAKAAVYAMAKSGVRVTVANRTPERGAALAEQINAILSRDSVDALPLTESEGLQRRIREADLLVNCTSVGMSPNTGDTPCPKEMLHPRLLVYDLVYNPVRTRLLSEAEEVGARSMNGVKMLVHQGAESFRIWLHRDPPLDTMEQIVVSALESRARTRGASGRNKRW